MGKEGRTGLKGNRMFLNIVKGFLAKGGLLFIMLLKECIFKIDRNVTVRCLKHYKNPSISASVTR